jgi:Fis family transcriptional regulator, factor for inversion stimulation protein
MSAIRGLSMQRPEHVGSRSDLRSDDLSAQLDALVRWMHASHIVYDEAVREFKKRFVETVLEDNRSNKSRTARALEMHRNTLTRTMHELDIPVARRRRRKPYVRVEDTFVRSHGEADSRS